MLPTRRKNKVGIMVVVHRQGNLLQIVLAISPPGRFPGLLDGGEEQRD